MKYLLFIFCFAPTLASTVELVKHQSDSEAASRQTFILNKDKVTFNKESNLFDAKKDYSLGIFETRGPDVLALNSKIEAILKKIIATDDTLKLKGLSFNELSKSNDHHQEMIRLDAFKVLKNSNFYAELDKIFMELQSKKFVHIQGIELGKDFKTISFYEKSKKIKTQEFSVKFSCKSESLPTVCRIKGEGFLFLE